jgi:hypothetical protein
MTLKALVNVVEKKILWSKMSLLKFEEGGENYSENRPQMSHDLY